MKFQKGVPRPPTAGRRAGTPNKRDQAIETFARSILEAPEYRENIRQQSQTGLLEPHVETLLYGYAYGRPATRKVAPGEEPVDDMAFMTAFMEVAMEHVTTREGRAALRAVVNEHLGKDRLKVVA